MKLSFKREQNRAGSNSVERKKKGVKLNIFKRLKAVLRLREAVRQADEAHCKNRQRYYVMPTNGTSGELVIMDRANFRKLKQKGYVNFHSFVADLERECFYCTPYGNGKGKLSAEGVAVKRKNYLNWLYAVEQLKQRKKKTEQQKNNQ